MDTVTQLDLIESVPQPELEFTLDVFDALEAWEEEFEPFEDAPWSQPTELVALLMALLLLVKSLEDELDASKRLRSC